MPKTEDKDTGRAEREAEIRREGFCAALAAVDKLIAPLLPRVSPGELRLGEVQELRAAVAALKPE